MLKDKDDERKTYYVPCGKCAWCRQSLRQEWFLRFKFESKNCPCPRFVTLTYDDEHVPFKVDEETGEVFLTNSKKDIQLFVKRMRKSGIKVRYFIASEYGPETGRPHYHGLLFLHEKANIKDFWKNGFVTDLPANTGSFKYVTKYLLKGSNVPFGSDPNFNLSSRRPGIGGNFNYKGQPYLLGENGVHELPGRYYRRRYINSLNDKVRKAVSSQTLEYLTSKFQFSDLYREYDKSDKAVSFEKWLDLKYEHDLKIQKKINNGKKK